MKEFKVGDIIKADEELVESTIILCSKVLIKYKPAHSVKKIGLKMSDRVRQPKTPIWKKSMLEKLNIEGIKQALWEIREDGDEFGYDDGNTDGYYADYKDQFDELAGMASVLLDALDEYGVEENWDDATVGLMGDVYTVLGYDAAEIDYCHLLSDYQEELATNEAAKRLLRLTKSELLALFRRVLSAITLFYDVKAAHDCLISIVEELDDRVALMKRKEDQINWLYKDLTGKNEEQFDTLVENLPPRMWVE